MDNNTEYEYPKCINATKIKVEYMKRHNIERLYIV